MAFPTNYQRRVDITIPSANIPVGETYTDVTIWLGNNWVPAEMIDGTNTNSCQADGGDIRVSTDAGGVHRVPIHISQIDINTNNISMFIKVPSISAGQDYTFYLWYNSDETETMEAAVGTYGQHATFSSYYLFYDFSTETLALGHASKSSGEALMDLTANSYDGTTSTYIKVWDGTFNGVMSKPSSLMPGKSFWDFSCSQTYNPNAVLLPNAFSPATTGLKAYTFMSICKPTSDAYGAGSQEDAGILSHTSKDSGQLCLAWGNVPTHYKFGQSDVLTPGVSDEEYPCIASTSTARMNHLSRTYGLSLYEDGVVIAEELFLQPVTTPTTFPAGKGYAMAQKSIYATAADDGRSMEIELFVLRIGSTTQKRAELDTGLFYMKGSTFMYIGTPGFPTVGAALTLTGLVAGSDVVILSGGTDTVLASVDQNAGTSWAYSYSVAGNIDIGIIKPGYVVQYIYGYTLTGTDTSIPIAQRIDRNKV